ncbi:MAG TPA: winged helix-turn-helix domain-containing protein [Puia sp.]|jgi:DNA-binding transcriptional ArsR family regulator|nr:winged helix-turn-helix domain-containing protein [Puia sp.]
MEQDFGSMAALIGEPVRARILWTLLGGRAYTATELANCVDTSPQNLSAHLARLVRADLLSVEVQGRHRYFSFSRPEVAYAVESLAGLLPRRPGAAAATEDPPIRVCRTCYDHLAGKVGVLVTEGLLGKRLLAYEQVPDHGGRLPGRSRGIPGRHIEETPDRSGAIPGKNFLVTPKGNRWFREMGIDCETLRRQRRGFARACLDWTERRPHLAGSLGAALLQKMLEEHWLRRMEGTRAVLVTPKGRKAMHEVFGIQI